MPEIEEFSHLYKLGADCVTAYAKNGFESSELVSLMQRLVDEVVKLDGIERGLIHAGAKLEMKDKWDKYAWVCSAIELVNQKCGMF